MITIIKIALNYALMLEIIRESGRSNDEIIELLDQENSQLFNVFGEGIPDWQTLIDYYKKNQEIIKGMLYKEYEITFLTKGALKSLLRIKYRLAENIDFQDNGEILDNIRISSEHLDSLRIVIAKNWTIHEINKEEKKNLQTIRIELTNKMPNHLKLQE